MSPTSICNQHLRSWPFVEMKGLCERKWTAELQSGRFRYVKMDDNVFKVNGSNDLSGPLNKTVLKSRSRRSFELEGSKALDANR